MTVNTTLATYSDWFYTTAIAIYVFSMLFYLAEQAFGRFSRRSERVEAGQVATATVGGGGGTAVADPPAPAPAASQERPLPERLGRMGVALTVLGVLLHGSAVLMRGLAVHRVPWGNMYEYGSAVCLVAMVAWLLLMRRFAIRRLTGFVLLPIVLLLFLGGTVLYANAAPLQPALQSYWLVIHVSAAATSSGILLLPGIVSLLYLVRAANERNPQRFAKLAARLPEADMLDRLAYRTTVFAFPLFTFGIVAGAIWAESAWGRFWGWDPKETCALVAWVVYASYLHARATAGWRGSRAAVINSLGFAVMVFNLFFINLVVAGLHSYAGVNG
jgi:cytochrome c-type biogenesis protein CcsB